MIAADATWRDKRWELDNVNSEFNKANKAVSKLKVAKEDATEAIAAVQAIKERMATIAEEEKAAEAAVNALLCKIGNLVHDSVPVSDDEENNVVYRSFGLDSKRTEEGLPNHVDLIAMLDIADTERGTDVAGGRGYFLKGAGVLLNQAMINYAIAFLAARGHTPLATPFFMRKDRMAECAQATANMGPDEESARDMATAPPVQRSGNGTEGMQQESRTIVHEHAMKE